MSGFVLRRAEMCELPGILAVIDGARLLLKALGIDQWQGVYPGRADIFADIESGRSYILGCGGSIAATVAICPGAEPSYETIDGSWRCAGEYISIHRIAVAAACRGLGAGSFIVSAAADMCRDAGIHALRSDTHADNFRMRGMLERNGFVFCGIIRLADGAPRVAYEKIID